MISAVLYDISAIQRNLALQRQAEEVISYCCLPLLCTFANKISDESRRSRYQYIMYIRSWHCIIRHFLRNRETFG